MNQTKRNRPSFGRPKAERGLDQFDTPPVALDPLFEHEPLLAGVTTVCEPFCGKGNLVIAMRQHGLIVHASDIQYRGCPDSVVLDFREMAERPPDCDVLISNCAYDGVAGGAMEFIEHAWSLGFRLTVLLLKVQFLSTDQRYERLHKTGHLRRVHVITERLQDMHDANFTGEKAGQSQNHAWFVLDRNYFGEAALNAVSIHRPLERMPWAVAAPESAGHRHHPPTSSLSATANSPAIPAKPGDTSMTKKTALHAVNEDNPEKPKLNLVDNPAPAEKQTTPTPEDARDIESLWDDPGLGDGLTDINLHSIPVDKPKDFFRVHPDPAYRRRTEMYIHKVDGEIEKSYFILGKKMKGRLEEARHCILVTCIYRDGSLRLWPIPLPRDGEKDNLAWSSARKAARTAIDKWVKLVWLKKAYHTRDGQPGYAPDPDWSKLPPFNDLVATGFGNYGFMEEEDHPIYRDLLGAPNIKNDDEDGL